jgi:hypothetical protein
MQTNTKNGDLKSSIIASSDVDKKIANQIIIRSELHFTIIPSRKELWTNFNKYDFSLLCIF